MNLSGIISIAGMSGLHKVVAQIKNGLIVESLVDKKRVPAYSTSKYLFDR
jgi:acyl transferase domain-containing protein